jgi:3-deoxy-D-manno-octulosonic-acid transferase
MKHSFLRRNTLSKTFFFLFYFLFTHLTFLFALLAMPLLHWKGKYRSSWRQRLFGTDFHYPKRTYQHDQVAWFHAISLGECKALIPLLQQWQKSYPNHLILATSSTETGYATLQSEAKDFNILINYLPVDLPWIICPIVKKVKPNYLFLVEGDFWLYHLTSTKKIGAKIFLVNGKISQRSFIAYSKLGFWGASLFYQHVDLFLVQNQLYYQRWLSLGIPPEKLQITGNLKFSRPPATLPLGTSEAHRNHWGYSKEALILVFASTHKGEESLFLDIYEKLRQRVGNLYCILVPRHIERSGQIISLIESRNIPYRLYSTWKSGNAPLVTPLFLIDAIGILPICYAVSNISIVGGSYAPVGGHNILEPAEFMKPILYGPYLHKQEELRQILEDYGASGETMAQQLEERLYQYLIDPLLAQEIGKRGYLALEAQKKALHNTYEALKNYINLP